MELPHAAPPVEQPKKPADKSKKTEAHHVAAPPPEPDHPVVARTSQGGLRYVIDLEGPPNLDTDTGFVLIAPRAIGIFPLDRNCNAQACHITAEVDPKLSVFFPTDSLDQSAFAIMATAHSQTYLWRFTNEGLTAAFDKVKTESQKLLPPSVSAKITHTKHGAEMARADSLSPIRPNPHEEGEASDTTKDKPATNKFRTRSTHPHHIPQRRHHAPKAHNEQSSEIPSGHFVPGDE